MDSRDMIRTDLIGNEKIQGAIRTILEEIGEDPNRDGLQRTPLRMTKAYSEWFSGYGKTAEEILDRTFDVDYKGMVVVKDIKIFSHCFIGETAIATPKGAKCIRSIKEGDEVYTFSEATNRLVSKKVLKTFKRFDKELRIIKTADGNTLKCTAEHPFNVKGKGWVDAKDLSVGDILYTPRSKQLFKSERAHDIKITYGYDLGYFFGMLLSDGSMTSRSIRLEINEYDKIKRFQQALKTAFNVDRPIETIIKPSGFLKRNIKQFRVRVSSVILSAIVTEFLDGVIKKTRNFHLPRVVLNDYETFKGFINGYVDGDGTTSTNKKGYSLSVIRSTNLTFMERMSEILGTKLTISRPPNSFSVLGTTTVPNFLTGVNKMGVYKERFEKKFEESIRNKIPIVVQEDIKETEVAEIKLKRSNSKPYTVYNLEIEDENTYIANNVWVHNCEHHLAPIVGVAHIAYIPRDRVAGLDKFVKLAEIYARRLQTQEQLTHQIAEGIQQVLNPLGVAVQIEAFHFCIASRETKNQSSTTVTTRVLGEFENASVKEEFYQAIGNSSVSLV